MSTVPTIVWEGEDGEAGTNYKRPGPYYVAYVPANIYIYKHCFTNTKDSTDVELENLFSLLRNLKSVINIWQPILNECKLVAENLGVLAEFTTI
jgi:hypothetical protein